MNSWLKNTIIYEIYPTSFCDFDGDGIGDLKGVTNKIPYLQELGVNAVWLNPFYASPFKDGGYDVSDYREIDERFGTMADFEEMVSAFKAAGIRVIIDLVLGHTSDEHEWFQKSALDERNEYSDRYIWTDNIFNKYADKTIHGVFPRNGGYYVNYYACQPALNYGFNTVEPKKELTSEYDLGESWKMHYTDERLQPLREEVLELMRFWLSKGVDGFRIDMANSLVKGCVYDSDDEKDIEGLIWLWNKLIGTIKSEYPDCAFIAEWIYPSNAVGKCGFDLDYLGHDCKPYNDLFRREKGTNLLPGFEKGFNYFGKEGKGSIVEFIKYTEKLYKVIQGKGYFSVPTGCHDEIRISAKKDEDLLKLAFCFLLTYKHVPLIYYGDELGLSHDFSLNKDGGYIRTGARTPMQWTNGKNRGFSTAQTTYLPTNERENQSVESQEKKENSLYHTVKKLIKIRKEYSCLNADGELQMHAYKDGGPLIYSRKDEKGEIIVAINVGQAVAKINVEYDGVVCYEKAILDKKITLEPRGYVILKKNL